MLKRENPAEATGREPDPNFQKAADVARLEMENLSKKSSKIRARSQSLQL